jgi:hypothetical protein
VSGTGLSINQAGACNYVMFPTVQQNFASGAGTGQFQMFAPVGCPWVVTANLSWVRITSGLQGTGNGTISYRVAPNPTLSTRSGSLTAGGRSTTIFQSATTCTFSINPTSLSRGPEAFDAQTIALTARSSTA